MVVTNQMQTKQRMLCEMNGDENCVTGPSAKGSKPKMDASRDSSKASKQKYNSALTGRRNTGKSIALDALKLAVALELRLQGYTHITFNEPIRTCNGQVLVHVFGEDDLGLSIAVYCINRPEKLNPGKLMDIVEAIQRKIGPDGDVVLALPVDLLEKVDNIYGLTPKLFIVDRNLRVWVNTYDRAVANIFKQTTATAALNEEREVGIYPPTFDEDPRTSGMQYIV